MNAQGMVAGMEGTGCCRALFWDESHTTMLVLPPIAAGAASAAWSINDEGTLIVGQSNSRAVAWARPTTTSAFVAIAFAGNPPCGSGANSIAYSVAPNLSVGTAGTIVGQECGAPVAWKVSFAGSALTVTQRVALPSPTRSTKGLAQDVNRRSGATGQAGGVGVFWSGF
jgi:uncharacterized membrane protein